MADSSLNIVITGVSRGLGRVMTEAFVEQGHIVHGCARDAEIVNHLRKSFPPPCSFSVVDVSNDQAVGAWSQEVLRLAGPPDLLLNNAAIVNHNAPLWEVPPEEFAEVVNINITGVYYVIRHFVPAMIERNKGVVVNFSSGWGRSTSPEVAPYCACKWAIEGLTQALAEELPNGMAAVPLNPGIINTDMLRSCFGSNAASYPNPQQWVRRAVPFLLKLSSRDNGKPLTIS